MIGRPVRDPRTRLLTIYFTPLLQFL
jgi:hypothetical protein